MMATLRAELYGALAEVFSDPPDWLALSGSEWPLYKIAKDLVLSSIDARQAIERIKGISPEPIAIRQERYDALFSGPGRPRFWLYESLYRSGKMLGSETMGVEGIYRTAGLVIEGAELPDHISLELAFLAYISNQRVISEQQSGAWAKIEHDFIKVHAGQWMPALGQDLADSGDEVYAPIGQLLAGWLRNTRRPGDHSYSLPTSLLWTPILKNVENCSLCGFCVQICPRRVLTIREDAGETVLLLTGRPCNGCGKCVRICPGQGLVLEKLTTDTGISRQTVVLRSSPRAHCPKCGRPTVSQAELESIVRRIGPFPWLELCQECRFILMEDLQ